MKRSSRSLDDIAASAYQEVVTTAERRGIMPDEREAMRAAESAWRDALQKQPAIRDELLNDAAVDASQRVHRAFIEAGKRAIGELASGQLRFAEFEEFGAIVPLGEGAVSTIGNIDDLRIDMMDESRKQNLFQVQRKYQEWSDGIRRPVKQAFRALPAGSTLKDAIDQGALT
jgi:hypothetical protein